jgi:hypothetical protein
VLLYGCESWCLAAASLRKSRLSHKHNERARMMCRVAMCQAMAHRITSETLQQRTGVFDLQHYVARGGAAGTRRPPSSPIEVSIGPVSGSYRGLHRGCHRSLIKAVYRGPYRADVSWQVQLLLHHAAFSCSCSWLSSLSRRVSAAVKLRTPLHDQSCQPEKKTTWVCISQSHRGCYRSPIAVPS